MEIKFHKRAVKFINSLPIKERQRIKEGIYNLISSPETCDIKPVIGYDDLYRLRIGQYRVIYTKDNVILFIVYVGNRGDIYKKYWGDDNMSENTRQLVNLFEILPENDQVMLLELTKKMLLAFDPDYTRLLPDEEANIKIALNDYEKGENIFDQSSINW